MLSRLLCQCNRSQGLLLRELGVGSRARAQQKCHQPVLYLMKFTLHQSKNNWAEWELVRWTAVRNLAHSTVASHYPALCKQNNTSTYSTQMWRGSGLSSPVPGSGYPLVRPRSVTTAPVSLLMYCRLAPAGPSTLFLTSNVGGAWSRPIITFSCKQFGNRALEKLVCLMCFKTGNTKSKH